MEKVHYIRNDVIFRQGDEAGSMYEVISGSVGIYTDYGKRGQKMLASLKEGQFFGEMAMIEGVPRSATAVALSDRLTLQVITWQTLGEFFRNRPSNVVLIMQQMGRRVRGMNEDYADICKGVAEIIQLAEDEHRPQEAVWIRNRLGRHLESYRGGNA